MIDLNRCNNAVRETIAKVRNAYQAGGRSEAAKVLKLESQVYGFKHWEVLAIAETVRKLENF